MTIDISTEIQAAYLLGMRKDKLEGIEDGRPFYIIKKGDPVPEGLTVGEFVYPEFDRFGNMICVGWGS